MRPPEQFGRRPGSGLDRALSKLGFCSRSQARELILGGQVSVDGKICRDPEMAVDWQRRTIQVHGQRLGAAARVYLMLNKPRGLVTTRADEQERATVYDCLAGKDLPWVGPVGRLDKASEGLLLFTNDNAWAEQILAPENHVPKTYHVQIDCLPGPELCPALVEGVTAPDGEVLAARQARVLRQGGRNSWLEIVLEEGRNRHIRRLLEARGVQVLRLIRIAIGRLELGSLAKGQVRHLTRAEIAAMGRALAA
jgi:23S rRNA pseudouridine2605 synthase